MLVRNTYSAPPPALEMWREVFRIEHRETEEGAFRSCAIEMDWHAFEILMPQDPSERAISTFLYHVSDTAIFAYLTLRDLLGWFRLEELEELEKAGYHISVFSVSNDPRKGARSPHQIVFIRSHARWLRYESLLEG